MNIPDTEAPGRCTLVAIALTAMTTVACAAIAQDAPPRRAQREATDARAFDAWSAPQLHRRAAWLEREILRAGPQDRSQARRRHQLATVYQALRRRALRRAARQRVRAQAITQWWRYDERRRLGRRHRHHRARARQWQWRAVYQWLEALEAPGSLHYRRIDEVMLRAAQALLQAGATEARTGWKRRAQRRRRDAYRLLERLVRAHPTSGYVGQALLALGEALRRRGRTESAAVAFKKVLRGPWAASHARAHLGLGRCLMAVNRPRRALGQFLQAHRLSGGSAQRSDIREALFAAWAVTGTAADAHALCLRATRSAPHRAKALFLALATWCGGHGRPGIATALWQRARRRWPRDRRGCHWWARATMGAVGLHHWQRVTRLLRSAPVSGHREGCPRRVERTLKSVATTLHAKGIQQRSLAMFNVSRLAYRQYAAGFPRSRNAYLMAKQHAELLWLMVLANLRSSGPTLRQVARTFDALARRARPPRLSRDVYQRQRRESALGAVRAWMKLNRVTSRRLTRRDRGLAGPRPCLRRGPTRCAKWGPPSLSRRPLSRDQRGLLRALRHYLRVAGPKAPYRAAVLYNLAHLYWRHNHLAEAVPHLITVAFKHSETVPEAARAAAFRAYHVLRALKQPRRARALMKRVLEHTSLMEEWSFRRQMRRLRTEARFARAAGLYARKQWRACGRLYAQLAGRAALHRVRAHLQAARCYDAAGDNRAALKIRRLLLTRGTTAAHAPVLTLRIARAYRRLARLKLAARWLERYVDRYPERRDAPTVHLEALRIRAGLGSELTLKLQLNSFLGRYGVTHPRLSARARWLWIQFKTHQGHTWTLPFLLADWLKRHAAHGRVERFLEASLRLATLTWRRSCRVSTTAGRCLSATRKSHSGAAPRPLLRRAPKLVRAARRVLSRALGAWAAGRLLARIPASSPDRLSRQKRARRTAKRITSLLAAVRRYRRCFGSARCRSGRSVPPRAASTSSATPGERWRKTTPPTFRFNRAGFDARTRRPGVSGKK